MDKVVATNYEIVAVNIGVEAPSRGFVYSIVLRGILWPLAEA